MGQRASKCFHLLLENLKMVEKYGAESIKVLEGLEGVRKRPAMYIGSTGKDGLHHLIYEAVDNSVDEALAGFCKNIIVSINKDGSATIEDDGRGIPVDMHPQLKIPAVQVALTKLHAGGKFDKKSYEISGGLHGVGISVVNALSKKLIIEVKREGKVYRQEYSRGDAKTKLEVAGKYNGDGSGRKVIFWPDAEIFSTVVFDYKVQEVWAEDRQSVRLVIEEKVRLLVQNVFSRIAEVLAAGYGNAFKEFVDFKRLREQFLFRRGFTCRPQLGIGRHSAVRVSAGCPRPVMHGQWSHWCSAFLHHDFECSVNNFWLGC